MNGKTTNCGCLQMPLFVEVAISRTLTVCSLLIRRKKLSSYLKCEVTYYPFNKLQCLPDNQNILSLYLDRYVQPLKFCLCENIFILSLFTPLTNCCSIIYVFSLCRIWFINSWKLLCDRHLTNIINISDIEMLKMFSTPK